MAQRGLNFWQRLAAALLIPLLKVWTRPRWLALSRIPATGPVIVVPNHVSHFDPLVIARYLYAAGRWPRFLGKSSLWKLPVLGPFLSKCKQIPVERGSVDAVKSLDALVAALNDGGVVVIYPEGTTTREPDLWPMRGKTGAARLALITGAPVIPLGNWGAERIFDPRTSKLGLRPRIPVAVAAGPPVDLSRWAGAEPTRAVLDEITDHIMQAVSGLVGDLRGARPPAQLYDRPGPPQATLREDS